MPIIIPHLWYDKQAKEAAEFYVSLFPNSKIDSIRTITGTPSGDCDIVSFTLWGQPFMSISAGPYFKFNPAVSFMVNFDPSQDPDAAKKLDEVWAKLIDGGKALMEIGTYPFSERYGWVQDKYGLTWQLILTKPEGEPRPAIMPSLLFTQDKAGQAEAATDLYLSVFQGSRRGQLARYPAGMEPDKEGTVMFTDINILNQWVVAMDSAHKHEFVFNEAVSFIISCDTQAEIDHYWSKLSAVPEAEQCGWLKDKFGVSWQVTPKVMDEMMANGDQDAVNRVTQAFLKMKKFDIGMLEQAFRG